MAHLLAAKYTPPASTQAQATTANTLFIVPVPITFASIDDDDLFTGRAVAACSQD
jgi:hypothetical protein